MTDYRLHLKTLNSSLSNLLVRTSARSSFSHAYLFACHDISYRIEVEVLAWIQEILASHDAGNLRDPYKYVGLVQIDGQKSPITKEVMTSALESLNFSTLDVAQKKFLWIKNVENASAFALNALLKTLEEPPQNVFIIMSTNALKRILETVISRTILINVLAPNKQQLIASLHDLGLKNNEIEFLALLESDFETAKNLVTQLPKILELKRKVLLALTRTLTNRALVYGELARFLTNKNDWKLVGKLLTIFWHDIGNHELGLKLNLKHHEATFKKYSQAKFDWQKAQIAQMEFNSNLRKNVNFDLARLNFLVKLEACYG